MNEIEKEKTASGSSSLQRGTQSREASKAELRKKIAGIRQGHATGGYCETETLLGEEKKLHHILSVEIEELGNQADHASRERKRALERELAGFAFRPRLVVAQE